jgi:hypothetical protein
VPRSPPGRPSARCPVRALVTLGTPFQLYRVGPTAFLPAVAIAVAGTLGATRMATLQCLFGPCCATFRRSLRAPVNGPFTSIYGRRDRVVSRRAALDPSADNVGVDAGHLTLLSSVSARRALAQALTRPVGPGVTAVRPGASSSDGRAA